MESIVISIGGSVILSEDTDVTFLKDLKTLLKSISKDFKIYVIVGGGRTARVYIKLGRKLNFEEEFLDEIGIDVTRANAKLLTNIIGISNKVIPKTTDEAKCIDKPIVVMGGTTPGHSTDMVGAELAEKTNSTKFVIATNVDGVYDKDPNKYNNAKQIKEITIDELIKEHGTEWSIAGKNIVIDGPALEIIKRAKIPTFVLNGKKLDELEKALTNQKFIGTIIKNKKEV
jgi:uridylate kinase